MNKKIGYIIGVIAIILVIGAAIWFILSGEEPADTASEIQLDGTWLVYQCGEDMSRTEYMVFSGQTVSDYRNGEAEPFASGTYTFDGSTLEVADMDLTFSVQVISENNIVLTEPNSRVWRLLLVGGTDGVIAPVTAEAIVGEYDVTVVGTEKRTNETITFENNSFSLVQNGAQSAASRYEMTDAHTLSLPDISREYYVYTNGNKLLLIGRADNGVWELVRK